MPPKTLIVTIPPMRGGVPTKTRILALYLRSLGHDVTIAHYASLGFNPEDTAPSWKLPFGYRPKVSHTTCFGNFPCLSVGCYLPEFEFSNYRVSPLWEETFSGFDYHIAVGGTVMVSYPLDELKIPHLVWCASTLNDDRVERRHAMPALRRWVDNLVIDPIQRNMEQRVLTGDAKFMAVSRYALDTLVKVGGKRSQFDVMPVPVDTDVFSPGTPIKGRIGMAGRHTDPRKNVNLLIEAIGILRRKNIDVELHLTGEAVSPTVDYIMHKGLSDCVRFTGWIDDEDLPDYFRALDVFVFSSIKEGLGISGVQAIASGVPVVSTRCGGAEDYVIDDLTGYLTDMDPEQMADAIARILNNPSERQRLGGNARALASENYAPAKFHKNLRENWAALWGENP